MMKWIKRNKFWLSVSFGAVLLVYGIICAIAKNAGAVLVLFGLITIVREVIDHVKVHAR